MKAVQFECVGAANAGGKLTAGVRQQESGEIGRAPLGRKSELEKQGRRSLLQQQTDGNDFESRIERAILGYHAGRPSENRLLAISRFSTQINLKLIPQMRGLHRKLKA